MNIDNEPSFGVAGFPPAFFKSEYGKKRENIFPWLKSLGLNWVELQNTYGVKMKSEQALLYKQCASTNDIGISLHAPYYITLASADNDIVKRSKERILQCFTLAEKINSKRIIFHPGHFQGETEDDREKAVKKITDGLNEVKKNLPNGIYIYPETAGKRSQIGSVEDIIRICELVDYARPCIDVAHVHGYEGGTLKTAENIIKILDDIEERLGIDYLKQTHFHMYPVEIDDNGEKKHKAFHDRIEKQQLSLFEANVDDKYYPIAEDFIIAIKHKNIVPVVICEARDSQDKGAMLLKSIYYGRVGVI
jgi:deoxyribonuclease-4